MTVIIKKGTKRSEVKKALEKVERFKNTSKGKGNIAHLFGSNPDEGDGLKFQKKVRKEWQ